MYVQDVRSRKGDLHNTASEEGKQNFCRYGDKIWVIKCDACVGNVIYLMRV